MPLLFLVFWFILGALVGSFLNVVICRFETKEQFIRGRSRCPHCRRELAWYDLLPLVSWACLRGRCRYCRHRLSWQYPLVEAAAGALFLLGGLYLPPDFTRLTFWTAAAFFYRTLCD